MGILKGFICVGSLENNTPGAVSQFGELSDIAQSYSREKARYPRASADIVLRSFTATDDNGVPLELPAAISSGVLDLAETVVDLYNNDQMTDFADVGEFITYLATQHPAPDYTGINTSALVPHDSDPDKLMPDFVAWTHNDGTNTFQVRIWFADETFRAQYDDYSILVLPPVTDPDDLDGSPAAVQTALNGYTKAQLIADLDAIKADHPFTLVKTHPLTWNDPGAGTGTLPTEWTVVIYGVAGDSNDTINQAIIEWLSPGEGNTTVPLNRWELIYPGLFSNTEFYLIPAWGQIAISEVDPANGIYSPIGDLTTLADNTVIYANGYDETYVRQTATVQSSIWKSLQFTAIGNVNNAGGNVRLNQVYPDYFIVSTSSMDFARMATETQQFAEFLTEMFALAETVEPSDFLPAGYTRVVRNGVHYLSFRLGEINFLCLTKYSFA